MELMEHLGLQGLILRSPGPDLDDGALGPPGFDFDAFSKFPGPELEVMGHLDLGDDCGASCASVGPNGHLGF